MAVNYLTLRSTISYATDGTQAPINSLMAVSSVGVTTWTNRIAISTLTASTITASTVSFSTMTVSTLNTFVVGQGAGTGAGNTVFGLNAATANTTGSGNTSFGFSTMSTNTTGIANTAMGYMALASNISSFNTAMGYAALASNISTMNTAVGALAMQNNTSGTLNVGIGYGALTSATNTISNTAVGTNAITGTTTGSYNTAIGMQTLFYNTTGQYNTCLGYSAGLSGAGTFTGSYNTYLGHLAYPSGMGVVNEIVLGGSSTNSVANTGNGSNSVTIGNSATTKHIFTAGNVGIGTTNPTGTLHISGAIDGGLRIVHTNNPSRGWKSGPDSSGNYILYTISDGAGVYLPFNGQSWAGNASDARSKTNIKSMDSVLDSLIKLRPVTFLYKTDPNGTISRSGFIAQEVDKVFPKETGWIVTQNTGLELIDDDGQPYNPYTIGMTEMIPYIVKGVQELAAENTQLKSAIAAQASAMALLEARLAAAGL